MSLETGEGRVAKCYKSITTPNTRRQFPVDPSPGPAVQRPQKYREWLVHLSCWPHMRQSERYQLDPNEKAIRTAVEAPHQHYVS